MVTLEQDRLVFRFPEVHEQAVLAVECQRTLRIPDDGRHYPLPPRLGRFPLSHVDDYAERLPASWLAHGGVFLPMYQAEALWLCFHSRGQYPFAVKVAAGKVNAVTGERWSNQLSDSPQDYLVAPPQPWLDGFCVKKGVVRQFVAMPLGEGYTAEEQLTGVAEHGGLQVLVYPMNPTEAKRHRALARLRERVAEVDQQLAGVTRRLRDLQDMAEHLYAEQRRLFSELASLREELRQHRRHRRPGVRGTRWEQMLEDSVQQLEMWDAESLRARDATSRDTQAGLRAAAEALRASEQSLLYPCASEDLGLAPGGKMRQEVYQDPYGLKVWETEVWSRCFVHLLNSLQYLAVTGSAPPDEPPSAQAYAEAGLPWFEYYVADQKALEGAAKLAGLESVAALRKQKGRPVLPGEQPIAAANVRQVCPGGRPVREPAEEAGMETEG